MPVWLVLSLLAQAPQPRAAFSSRSELVVLRVSVVDRHAGFVSGLPREAFVVHEDGRPQPVEFFENEDTPVTVGLLIDNSGSMQPRRDSVIAAGMAFAGSSHPADELFTLNFNEQVWPGLPPEHPFTSDRDELRRALDQSTTRGQTALFDAIAAGLRQLDEGHKTRKVLVVVSDGGDNASHTGFAEVLDAALRKDVVIYTIGIYDPDDHDAKPGLLRQIADATGGEAFFPRELTEVTPLLERIARDIRSSYTIGYAPPGDAASGRRRSVRVDVHSPDGRKLAVRARSSYISSRAEGGHGK
ncbi:MAG TPA: VWA domain-containing protein [Vicinamibacterales bacterium]